MSEIRDGFVSGDGTKEMFGPMTRDYVERLTRERDECAKAMVQNHQDRLTAERERDEARAEINSWKQRSMTFQDCMEASDDENERLRARVAELEAEVGEWQRQAGEYAEDAANLERGLAVYRKDGHWHVEDAHGADADLSGYGPCGVCTWEREQREQAP